MSNVIYRGSVKREPQTVNIVINDTSAPGAVVKLHNGKLEAAADLKGRRFLLGNNRFKGQTIEQAYAKGDTATAFRLEPEQEYYAQIADGTYNFGDELTVKTSGRQTDQSGDGRCSAIFLRRRIAACNQWRQRLCRCRGGKRLH
ncbi:hypothetical protein [Mannheimia haemolytica]|uniref:hypothetical protein n=1 Tax=Mannheimia haemolytica TaxID=75985 RepID=UPI001EFF0090|nr:hypothetical protein [Mannheimia haemolytica]